MMTSQLTLRRKLQKKLKHKPRRKCLKCGRRMDVMLVDDQAHSFDVPRLFVVCGKFESNSLDNGLKPFGSTSWTGKPLPQNGGCGNWYELFWSGGGIGRHIPHGQPGGERPQGCAGSSPALTIGGMPLPSSQEQR